MITIKVNEEGSLSVDIDDKLDPLQALGILEVAKAIILGQDADPTTSPDDVDMDDEFDIYEGTSDLDFENESVDLDAELDEMFNDMPDEVEDSEEDIETELPEEVLPESLPDEVTSESPLDEEESPLPEGILDEPKL